MIKKKIHKLEKEEENISILKKMNYSKNAPRKLLGNFTRQCDVNRKTLHPVKLTTAEASDTKIEVKISTQRG